MVRHGHRRSGAGPTPQGAMDFTTAWRTFIAFKRDERRDRETLTQYEGHLERWDAWRSARGCG